MRAPAVLPQSRTPEPDASPAFDRDGSPSRKAAAPSSVPRRPRSAWEGALERSFADLPATTPVDDRSAARAELTRALLGRLASQLGLEVGAIEVDVGPRAAARTRAARAHGLTDRGVVFLAPEVFDPGTVDGRGLLAHEIAHLSQQRLASSRGASSLLGDALAEVEAEALASAFATTGVMAQTRVPLSPERVAARSAVGAQADSLIATVRASRAGEIARIIDLLSYGAFDWAIHDDDVAEVLHILAMAPMLTARAMAAAIGPKYRRRLFENLSHGAGHYDMRTEILAVAWAKEQSESWTGIENKLLLPLPLTKVSDIEAVAIDFVVEHLSEPGRKALFADTSRASRITEIQQRATGEHGALAFATELEDAQKEEQAAAAARRIQDPSLGGLADDVYRTLRKFAVRDKDALRLLDRIAAECLTTRDPSHKFQALANAIRARGGEQDLDELIEQIPMSGLYRTEKRRKAFIYLASTRSPFKNEQLAYKVMRAPWWKVWDWGISSEEAFLAFLLVKAMPSRARSAFFSAHDADKWYYLLLELPVNVLESDTFNLYTGGAEHRDEQSILAQLTDASLWTREKKDKLDAVIRMARAAGHGEFVFEQSRERVAYARDKGLHDIVAKYELYDPVAQRTTYTEKPLTGHRWYEEGPFSLVGTLLASLDFVFRSDNVDLATFSIGGKGLNLAELQDVTGGSFVGARFRRPSAREKALARSQRQMPSNFADARWDTAKGRLDLTADTIELERVSFPLEDLRISTGPSTLKGVVFSVRYDPDAKQLRSLDVRIAQVFLHDLLFTVPESMTTANHAHVTNLRVLFQAADSALLDPARPRSRDGFLGWLQLFPNLWNLAVGRVKGFGRSRISELARSFKSVGAPREFVVSFDAAQLRGVATSSGQFIQQIDVGPGALHMAGTAASYRRALGESARRLEQRVSQERSELHRAQAGVTSQAELSRRQRAIERLQRLLDGVRKEMTEGRPAGSTVDVSRVTISAIEGLTDKPIQLADVHGHGRSVTAIAPLVSGSTRLRDMLAGKDNLVTLSASLGEEQGFGLDAGSIAADDLRLAGEVPTKETARKDLETFEANHGTRLTQHEFDETRKRLAERLTDALLYERLANRGFQNLKGKDAVAAGEARQRLIDFERKRATVIGSIAADNVALTIDAAGRPGARAEALVLQDVRTFTPDAAPDVTIGEIAGSGLEVNAALRGGLGAAGKSRKTLERLAVSGRSVSFKAVKKRGVGALDELAIEGEKDAPFAASLERDPTGATTLGARSRRIMARGLSGPVFSGLLRLELERLKELPAPRPDQRRRIGTIQTMLTDLTSIDAARRAAEDALGKARSTAAREAAATQLAAAKQALVDWERRLAVEKLTVEYLNVTVGGLGDLLSDEYDFASGGKQLSIAAGPGAKDWFQRAEAEGVRIRTDAGEQVVAKKLVLGATGGTLARTETGYRLSGFRLAALRAHGISFATKTMSVTCAGETTLTGVEIDAEIATGGDGQRLTITRLFIDRIFADRLRYEDADKIVTVKWGDLQGVRIDGLTVTLPADPTAKATVDGRVSVDQFKSLVVGAVTGGRGVNATITSPDPRPGATPVAALAVRVASSGDLQVSLAGVTAAGTVTAPRVEPGTDPAVLKRIGPHSIEVLAKNVSGTLTRSGDNLTVKGLIIGQLTLSRADWRAGNKTIRVADRVTLTGITVDAEASLQQKGGGGERQLSRLVITRLTVPDIDARDVSVTIGRVDGDPVKGIAGSPQQVFHFERAHIVGLTVTGFDVLNTRGVIEVKKSLSVTNLHAVVGEAAKGQILGARLSLDVYGREAEAPGKGGHELSATINGPDGTIIRLGRVDQALLTDATNTKEILPKRWTKLGTLERASVQGVTTGDIVITPNEVTVSSIGIESIAVGRTMFASSVPGAVLTLSSAKIPGKVTIWDIRAKFKYVPPTATTKATHELESITVDDLSIERIDAEGLDYVGPVAGAGAGVTKEMNVSFREASLRGLFLDNLSYSFGRQFLTLNASLKSVTADRFAFELAQSIGRTSRSTRFVADVEAKGLTADATFGPGDVIGVGRGQTATGVIAGQWRIDSVGLYQIGGRLRASGEQDKKFSLDSKSRLALGGGRPGIEMKGITQTTSRLTVESVKGRALVFRDPNIGLTLDIREADVPEGLEVWNDGFTLLRSARIRDAYFRIDDVKKLGGGGGKGAPSRGGKPGQWISYLDVLDHLNGRITGNLYLPINVTKRLAIRQEVFPLSIDITNGKFDYNKTEDAALWSRNDLLVSLEMDDGKLALQVFDSNKQTWTPGSDAERAEMDSGLVRVKRIVLPDEARRKAMGIPEGEPGLEPGGPIAVLGDLLVDPAVDWLRDGGTYPKIWVELMELRDLDARLGLTGEIPVNLPNGKIVLGGGHTRDAMTDLVLKSQSAQRLTWSLNQLNARVEELNIAGAGSLGISEIAIKGVRDASLEFYHGRAMYPRQLEGTITEATVRSLGFTPEKKP